MHIHDGPTGRAIREERNHKINKGKQSRTLYGGFRLKRHPNPFAVKTALFKERYGIA